jgi:LAS superfamily LD-carboxypeptidase LdcB
MGTKLPVRRVTQPADLTGQRNGELAPRLLVDIGNGGRLHHQAARAWVALWVAAKAAGINLTWTHGGTYRPLDQQERLFLSRFTTTRLPGRPQRTWGGQTWWLKPGVAMAATPGGSNHGWGLAIDLAHGTHPDTAKSTTRATTNWLIGNAESLGWSFELQSEPWHVRYTAGDKVPQRVLDIEAFLAAQPKG